jgi:ribose/xylose/arabinose/galactoside ABC-type transport system permease subunit
MTSTVTVTLTYSAITGLLGVVMSIFFEYFPGLHTKYNAQPDNVQRLIMLGCLVAMVLVIFLLGCIGWVTGIICTVPGAQAIIWMLLTGIVANQGVFPLLPKSAPAAVYQPAKTFPAPPTK